MDRYAEPLIKEEGPFPLQGNIGSIINNHIGQSNFSADVYTRKNTCGKNCIHSAPEAFGLQSFALGSDITTNIHGLHSTKNLRAGIEGKGPSDEYGCYDWAPVLSKTDGNSCQIRYDTYEKNTVGDFTKLDSWKKFSEYKF